MDIFIGIYLCISSLSVSSTSLCLFYTFLVVAYYDIRYKSMPSVNILPTIWGMEYKFEKYSEMRKWF